MKLSLRILIILTIFYLVNIYNKYQYIIKILYRDLIL